MPTGTAAHTSGTPLAVSSTWVARRLRPVSVRRLRGIVGSLSLAPNRGSVFFVFVASYNSCAYVSRSSWTSRAFSSIETRAALWTTKLSATAVSAPTAAIAMLIFQRTPVRRAGRFMA